MNINEYNEILKNVAMKNDTSIMLYNLKTGTKEFSVVADGLARVTCALEEKFPNQLVESKLISQGCISAFNSFVESMNNGIPNGQCNILFRAEVNLPFTWMRFDYSIISSDFQFEPIVVVSYKEVNSEVNNRLISGFWIKKIKDGVSHHGNSYFLVNVNDGVIFDACGKLAIKTSKLDEQVKYIAGLCCEESMAQTICDVLSQDNLIRLYNQNVESETHNVLIQDLDGIQRWFEINIFFSNNYLNKKLFAHIEFLDIDIKFRAVEDIKYNATHDLLTNVLNKHAFTELVIQTFNTLNRSYWNALVFIDVDNFKKVNDTLGHNAGDKILRNVANGIKKSFRGNDIIGRIGGDEFMVLFSTPTLFTLYSRVNILNRNIRSETQMDDISVSFGVVIINSVDHFERLYELSDFAMYHAKEAGKNRYCIIDESKNIFLSEAVAKVDNKRIGQMLNSNSKEYMFCHCKDGEVLVDYVTPKMFIDFFKEQKIEKFEQIKEFVNTDDFDKFNSIVQQSIKEEEIFTCSIEHNNIMYIVKVLSVFDKENGSIKLIMRFNAD